MSNAVMLIQHYDGMCEKIRELTGSTDVIKSGELPDKVAEVYEAGKQAEYDAFWDAYQNYGKLRYYKMSFAGNGWNKDTFKPKYDIIDTNGQAVFQESTIYVDLREHLNNLGVRLDTSGAKTLSYYFYSSKFSALPEISTLSSDNLSYCFQLASELETIDKLILKEDGSQTFTNTFASARKLKNITIEGVIGRSINFSYSPLTVESMKSAIKALKKYTGTGSEGTCTLTLQDSCKTALQADTETVELDGVSYTYFELITAKGWNLA